MAKEGKTVHYHYCCGVNMAGFVFGTPRSVGWDTDLDKLRERIARETQHCSVRLVNFVLTVSTKEGVSLAHDRGGEWKTLSVGQLLFDPALHDAVMGAFLAIGATVLLRMPAVSLDLHAMPPASGAIPNAISDFLRCFCDFVEAEPHDAK